MPRDVRTRPYGIHLMFDGYEADNKKLADVDLVYQTLNDLPDLIGMTKVGFPHVIQFKDCDIAGLSAFVFIVESHISIHTYARKGFISLDAYSCKPFNPGDVIDHIQKAFDVKKIEHKTASRGTYFPVN